MKKRGSPVKRHHAKRWKKRFRFNDLNLRQRLQLLVIAGAILIFITYLVINYTHLIYKAADILPLAPSRLTAADEPSTGAIKLSWTDNSFSETGFVIEKTETFNSDFAVAATVGADTTSYTDQAQGVRYFYRVKALSPVGDSAYSAIATPTRTERRDFLNGFGDFEHATFTQWQTTYYRIWKNGQDEPTADNTVAQGWTKVTGEAIQNPQEHTIARLVSGDGVRGSKAQYLALKGNTEGGGDMTELFYSLPIDEARTDSLHYGDEVNFTLDKLFMNNYDILPPFTQVHYSIDLSFVDKNYCRNDQVSRLKEFTPVGKANAYALNETLNVPASDTLGDPLFCGSALPAKNLQIIIRIETVGDIGAETPGFTVDGAHLYAKRAGDADYATVVVPVTPQNQIQNFMVFPKVQSSDLYEFSKKYNSIIASDTDNYNSVLKYYNPNLKIFLYNVAQIGDWRADSAGGAEPLGRLHMNMTWVLENHPDWLIPFDPAANDIPSGDRRQYQNFDPNQPAIYEYRLYQTDGTTPMNFVFDPWYQNSYFVDVTKESYQTAWTDNIIDMAKRYRADGVFLDAAGAIDIDYYLKGTTNKTHVFTLTDRDEQAFIANVVPALKNAGLEVMENLATAHNHTWPGLLYTDPFWDPSNPGTISPSPSSSPPLSSYLKNTPQNVTDIFFQEWAFFKHWSENGDETTMRNRYLDTQYWLDSIKDMEKTAEWNLNLNEKDKKKIFQLTLGVERDDDKAHYAVSPANIPDLNSYDYGWANFSYASYLLGANDTVSFQIQKNDYPVIPYETSEVVEIDHTYPDKLGKPIVSRNENLALYPDKTLQTREFSGGLVIANGSGGENRTYTLPRAMQDDLGRDYPAGFELTLKPHSGRLFFNTGGASNLEIALEPGLKTVSYKNTYLLKGTKTAGVTEVLIGGTPATVDNTANTWEGTVTLNSGDNLLSVVGKDSSQNTTAPLTLTVDYRRSGDSNDDGKVDILDFASLMLAWQKDPTLGSNYLSNFNEDSEIGILDFAVLMQNWDK